eukprot:11134-Heterococcus_DN1.PRE.1
MNVIVQELLSRPEWRDGTKDQLYSTIFMAKRHQLEYKERPDDSILVCQGKKAGTFDMLFMPKNVSLHKYHIIMLMYEYCQYESAVLHAIVIRTKATAC